MKEEKNNLMGKLFKLNMLLHRHHHSRVCGHGFGNPNRGQGRILSLLKMKPGISQKDLSFLLDMRSQSLGELLAKLESSGYITRTHSESDRRVMDIQLTEEGMTAAAEAEKNRDDSNKFFNCLNDEEYVKFGELLDKVIDSLEKELGQENVTDGIKGMFERHKHIHTIIRHHGRDIRDYIRGKAKCRKSEG